MLPDEVLGRWATIPGAGDLERYRAEVHRRGGKLWARMLSLERQCAAGVIPAVGLAELWAWCSNLALVSGYPENTTVAVYVGGTGRLMAWANEQHRDFTALTLPDFDDWQKWLAITMRNAADWRTTQVAAARSFYVWRSTRDLGPNCAQHVRVKRRGLRMARKYTDAQMRAMLLNTDTRSFPAIRHRDRTILLLLIAAGPRREELQRLSPHDLELGQQTGVIRFHGKGAKEREVPIEGPIVKALQQWLGYRDALPFAVDPDALFVVVHGGFRGKRITLRSLEHIVAHHAAGAKVRDFGVHRFRVNFATALYDDGAGIEEIRTLLGHESIETTRRYISVSERSRKTRLSAAHQHRLLGSPGDGQPRWMRAAMGGIHGA